MTLSLTLTRAEEAQIVAYVKQQVPAAAALQGLELNAGHVDATLDTPAGKVTARVELLVTDAG